MQNRYERNVYCIGGLPFDAVTLNQAAKAVDSAIQNKQPCFLSTPNLNFLIACQSDWAFRDSVINSDLSIADGMPIILIAKLLKLPFSERVAGSTLFDEFGQRFNTARPLRIFFFGGEAGVAETACEKLSTSHPNFNCAGFIDPGFVSVEAMSKPEYLEKINQSNADFLVVSLGAKKGQQWIEQNRGQLSVPVFSHLGAVVNFVAGTVNRSPVIMQKLGLEWLWRIKEEPALWKRYWGDGAGFLKLLMLQVLPYAIWIRLNVKKQSGLYLPGPAVETVNEHGTVRLELSGIFADADFACLRSGFEKILAAPADVIIDCQQLEFIDSSFVATVQLFARDLSLQGKSLKFKNLSRPLKKVFYWSGAKYLLK